MKNKRNWYQLINLILFLPNINAVKRSKSENKLFLNQSNAPKSPNKDTWMMKQMKQIWNWKQIEIILWKNKETEEGRKEISEEGRREVEWSDNERTYK